MERNDLLKHLHSYDKMIGENSNLSYPSDLVKELMEIVEKTPARVWIVQQESNVDGEIIINSVPCASLEAARKVLQDEKETILNESPHYDHYTPEELEEEFEIEEDDDRWYINDPCDDYYEDIKIIEKNIVE